MNIPSDSIASSIAGVPKATRQSAAAKTQQSESTRQARDEKAVQAAADENAIEQGDQAGQRDADGRQLAQKPHSNATNIQSSSAEIDSNPPSTAGLDYHA